MKNFLFLLPLMAALCSPLLSKENNIKTIEGTAQRSKAGLVVEGIMITPLSEEEMNSYEGKKIRVTGYIAVNHKWRIDESDPVKRQGFNMPVMYKVISIEIIKE